MEIKTIDLYKHFGLERNQGAKGYLKCYIQDNPQTYKQKYTYPAILIMAGGGYAYVSAREAEPVALRYLAFGFQAFVLEYSTGASHRYPTQLIEAAMAMIFIRENAKDFDLSNDMVCALGFSAGGHLCGCLATLFDEPILKKTFAKHTHLIKPNAIVLCYPVIVSGQKSHSDSFDNLCGNDQELKQYLSLDQRVSPNSCPAFIWHTFTDASVPVYNSLAYALACEKNKVPFALHIFEKGTHGLSTAQIDTNSQDVISQASTNIDQWTKLSIDWLKDRNIKITPQK